MIGPQWAPSGGSFYKIYQRILDKEIFEDVIQISLGICWNTIRLKLIRWRAKVNVARAGVCVWGCRHMTQLQAVMTQTDVRANQKVRLLISL